MTTPKPIPTRSIEPVFRVVGFGDPHLALPAPADRDPLTFASETENLVEQVMETATLAKADALFCTGDWFHLKASTSIETIRWAIETFRPLVRKFGPILTVAGNHDMVGSNVADSLNRQPIAILESAGIVERVDQTMKVVIKGGQTFGIIGTSYPNVARLLTPFDFPIIRIMHGEPTDLNVQALLNGPQVVVNVNGHIHCPSVAWERNELNDAVKAAVKWFVWLGTLTRVSRAEADWTPRLAVVTLAASGARVQLRELTPTRPGLSGFASDVSPAAQHASVGTLRDFANHLSASVDDAVDPKAMLADFAAKGKYPEAVFARAQAFLDEASA